jgi:drug/metabolite transporter (DMT)-like permease
LLYGLIVLMLLCWSGNYVAAKVVFREIPPMLAMALRTFVAAALMIPIYLGSKRSASIWNMREFGKLAALGILGMVMNQLFWTLGVARTTVVHSSMIMGTVPVWVLLLAAMLGLEKITIAKSAGIAIALAGVTLLQLGRANPNNRTATVLGDFLVVLCALALAGMTAFGKRFRPVSGPVAANAVGYIGGAILLLPAFLLSSRGFDFSRITPAAWAGILYMGVVSSVIGYMIYYYALPRIPASRMATFQYLQPVFASLMAVVMLGEEVTAAALAAGGVIFTGVLISERSR